MITDPRHDPMGQAMLDYYHGSLDAVIRVLSDVADDDVIPARYLFRSITDMPLLEKRALDECRGKVLDIGAGAGSHSLALQSRGHEVVAMDISPGAVEVMHIRGVKDVLHRSVWEDAPGRFDTILMMMNGIGLVGNLSGLERFFHHISSFLQPGGHILLDSSDLMYLFPNQDEAINLLMNEEYHGIVNYKMVYQHVRGKAFDWIFLDYQRLAYHAKKCDFQCELLQKGGHFDYLARLWVDSSKN
ncbi:MAG: methyltransferase domain-containing protein [Bacteroidota bacterium]